MKSKYTDKILNLEDRKTIDIVTIGYYTISLQRGNNYRVWVNGSLSIKYSDGIIANDFLITNKKAKKELYRLFWELENLKLK